MKKYSLLYFQHINDKFSKWIFPLHEGENIIGSDKEVDIFLYLNEKEDIIDSVHCKIILYELQNEVGIINLSTTGNVKREENEEKMILSPGKEYELNNKTVFYLTNNVKFILIKGTIDEIHDYFINENLENEFQKWHQFILAQESNTKINLNLTRRESYNKSFNNENNNLNISLNNNIMNIGTPSKNMNNNISNSNLGSNSKEVNRIGFNNFDEVPEDNLIDYKISQQNPINPVYNKNIINNINPIINTSPYKILEKEKSQNNENINNNPINNKEMTKNNSTGNEKEIDINSIKSEIKKKNNYYKSNNEYNNSLDLFKQTSLEFKKNNNEKAINKDENTIQIIKELLGENNLEILFNNTNYKNIRKYDIIIKKSKNNIGKVGVEFRNFDVKIRRNDFLRNNIRNHKI
jgi:hypothetical protein